MELDPNIDWVGVSNLMNQIRTLYPNMAWMLDEPDLRNVIIQAGIEQWDEGRVTAAVQGTEWWKARNESARSFSQLMNTDPASAEQQVQAFKSQILLFAGQNGLTISDNEALYMAWDGLKTGKSQQEWQAGIAKAYIGERGQDPKALGRTLNTMAADYAVPLSADTLKQWEMNVLSGTADEQTFRAYLAEQAKSLFPSLSNAIDRGITVKQYVAPYQEIAAQELGINPTEIDWRDPKWNVAIHRSTTNGPVAMSLSEWTKELRTNAVYGYDQTQKAQEEASQLGQALLQRFGRAA